jgi:hypothetical protein
VAWGAPLPKKRSKQKVAFVVAGVTAAVIASLIGAVVAWNAAINRIEDEAFGGPPGSDGDYYEVPGTGDPALVAGGNKFLSGVDAPAGAVSDPYGTACWVIGASLCMTSDDLAPGDLLDAASAQVHASGAELKKRWCFIDQCYAYLKYQGAPLMLVVDDPEEATPKPVMVTGFVVTDEDPDAPADPAASLGTWASLSATPRSWKAPRCVQRDAGGCRQFDGSFAAKTSPVEAVKDLRRTLESAGYALTDDTCPETGAIDLFCTVDARRFRTVGSLDGLVLTFRFEPAETGGFRVEIKGEPYPTSST